MYLDKNGLPVQADGDANDQLQRVGMIATGLKISPRKDFPVSEIKALKALKTILQPRPGVFVRNPETSANNCSADQIVSALSAFVIYNESTESLKLFLKMMLRLGFAQNYKDGLNSSTHTKLPDFMFLRAMPLFSRTSWLTWPLAWIFDAYLLVMVVSDWLYKLSQKDPSDCNNTVMTLAVCKLAKPTVFSLLATSLAKALRLDFSSRLARYHRSESGGNPEIAQLWEPICKYLF